MSGGVEMTPQVHRLRFRGGHADNSAPDSPASDQVDVGRRLRQLRTERDLSIRALAEASGVSVNTLSLIENGKTSPSVSTLQRVAAALNTPITTFFETEAPASHVVHVKAHQRPGAQFEHGSLADLGAGLSGRPVQPFLITLEPHSGSGQDLIVHTGYEFVYCLSGRLTYVVEDRTFLLDPGDSLVFESHLPHCWHNDEAEPTRALLVLYPTDERDRPTERHFAPLARPDPPTSTE
jgi:transcriptional regulator with XRE-family HTH domain